MTNVIDMTKKTEVVTTTTTKPKYIQKVYTYNGRKNQTDFPEFVELCKYTQAELKQVLALRLLAAGYTDVIIDDGYIYAKGSMPVLLTAHMDTVHKEPVKDFYEDINKKGQHVIASPQGIGGDDRCGIYMILEIIKEHKCSVLFCEDEESGGIGSSKFCKTELLIDLIDLNYLIELDRANGTDAVFYDCDNPEFTKFIEDNTGYKEEWGSFSDISTLAPACGVAAVNLSCGYYHAHTLGEEVVVEEMLNTIEVVKKLLTVECKQFEYIERKYYRGSYGYGSYYGNYGNYGNYGCDYNRYYGKYDPYDDDDYYWEYINQKNKKSNPEPEEAKLVILYVTFYDENFQESLSRHSGDTLEAAWLDFFRENGNICWNMVIDFEIDEM